MDIKGSRLKARIRAATLLGVLLTSFSCTDTGEGPPQGAFREGAEVPCTVVRVAEPFERFLAALTDADAGGADESVAPAPEFRWLSLTAARELRHLQPESRKVTDRDDVTTFLQQLPLLGGGLKGIEISVRIPDEERSSYAGVSILGQLDGGRSRPGARVFLTGKGEAHCQSKQIRVLSLGLTREPLRTECPRGPQRTRIREAIVCPMN